jgi:hypothetical protein
MYSINLAIMNVVVTPMRTRGVEVPRRMLSDRFTVTHKGALVIMDVTDQGLRRPVKVARLHRGEVLGAMELMEPHIIWANDGRFVLAGFERLRNDAGEVVSYAQSWLCKLDMQPASAGDGAPVAHRNQPSR